MKNKRIIISGGGTGGHIFPGIAIGSYLKKNNSLNQILFVGAFGNMEMKKVPKARFIIWVFFKDKSRNSLALGVHGTLAQKKFVDNVPMEIKNIRLNEIILKQKNHSYFRNQQYLNTIVCVLIEKESKKSDEFWSGRTTQNTVVVFPKKNFSLGDFVDVRIENCTSATLIGDGLRISKDI